MSNLYGKDLKPQTKIVPTIQSIFGRLQNICKFRIFAFGWVEYREGPLLKKSKLAVHLVCQNFDHLRYTF